MIENNKICSLMEVYNELNQGDDNIASFWKDIDNKYGFFIDLSEKNNSQDYWDVMFKLEEFVEFQKYGENKKFWADPYIISKALVDKSIVITNESSRFHKKIKIPYVCEELGVKCINFDEFMIREGWEW